MSQVVDFLKRAWAPVTGVVATLTALGEFLKLVQGNTEALTWILASLGMIALFISLIYIGYGTATSPVDPHRRLARYPRARGPARIAVILLLLATLSTLYLALRDQTANDKIVVLVAKFDGPDPQNYRVTDIMLKQLHQSLDPYKDTIIQSLDISITEQDGSPKAQIVGQQHHASLVLWGWYGVTKSNAMITVHVENLVQSPTLPISSTETYDDPASVDQIESFQIQQQLSGEMASFTLFTTGAKLTYKPTELPAR
jgi:hypothetical protein